jgi:hypothetical protein
LVSPVAFLQLDLPGYLVMAQLPDNASETQSVITETYGELEILVPEAFREYSKELLENQKRIIDLGSVLKKVVNELTIDYTVGWTFEQPPHRCYHMSIPPIRREELRAKYSYIPVLLVGRKSFIEAGVFAVPVRDAFCLPAARFSEKREIEWPCFKKYLKELPAYINSAEQHTGSLVITLHTYRYNQTRTS